MEVALRDPTSAMEDLQLLYLDNESYHLVDALPYIDTDYGASAEISMEVKKLIESEMRDMKDRNYLEKMNVPATPFLDASPLFKDAQARFARGEKIQAISQDQYKMEAPQGPRGRETGAWERAVEKAGRISAIQDAQALNLDLLSTLGKPAWITYVPHVAEYETSLTARSATMRKSCEEVNKRRKLDQIATGNQLRSLTRQCEDLERNSAEVDEATALMHVEVRRLKQFAQERGVLPAEFIEAVDAPDVEMEGED